MSGTTALDAEALLEEAEKAQLQDSRKHSSKAATERDHRSREVKNDDRRRDDRRARERDSSRDRDRRRPERSRERRERNGAKEDLMSSRSGRDFNRRDYRRRSHSRERDNRRRRPVDIYRHWGVPREGRSRSPDDDRYYRPSGDRTADRRDVDRRRERDNNRDRNRRRRDERPASPARKRASSKTPEPEPTEDERDKRTVFVQQLAARLRTKELMEFFERAGPVKEAQIVKDRISGRSKGVGYVEFRNEEAVQAAIQLTGQKLLGIPIIAQLTEAEKNRQARTSGANGNTNSIPYHRLYVGNIHFSVTEEDVSSIFEPFGELEFVQLQKDDQERSRGYGFVQFVDPENAKEALEKMNNFTVAGRAMRVGLGNDRFTHESTQTMLQKFGTPDGQKGSQFSGSGGRGIQAGGTNNFDRPTGRDDNKGTGASALDDTDVSGVNFQNFSRASLMQKLARAEDNFETEAQARERAMQERIRQAQQKNTQTFTASRCLLLQHMFNPDSEEGPHWVKELEEEIRTECDDKYGKVVHISVDPSSQGDVYIAFAEVKGGDNALKGLNGRMFGGSMITAQPMVEAVYRSQFPQSV